MKGPGLNLSAPTLLLIAMVAPQYAQETHELEAARLIDQLGGRTWEAARDDLAKMGEAAVPPLIEALQDRDPERRWQAERSAYALAAIGTPEAVRALLRVLTDQTRFLRIRAACVEAVGEYRVAEGVSALVQRLSDPNSLIRSRSVQSLAQIGTETALEAVSGAVLRDLELVSSEPVWRALSGTTSRKSGEILTAALAHPKLSVWTAGRDGLVHMGQAAEEDVFPQLQHPEPEIRRRAVQVLGHICSFRSIPGLVGLLGDPDWMVRNEASVALSRFKKEDTLPALLPALQNSRAPVREEAAWLLGEIAATKAEGDLEALLSSDESAWIAAISLAKLGAVSAVGRISDLLKTGDTRTRKAAAWSLGHLESPASTESLQEALQDPDQEVRMWAKYGLNQAAERQGQP